ncbi:transposase [Leptothermofonsia sp. ETS-13]|uniref:transposase n=1 Tax=Leptothermofonsia sp. ETS-13 TaxID=3035696 RepID=UPI003B9FB99E
MSQPFYDSDLSDQDWERIEPLLLGKKPLGKNREVTSREVLNAIFYRADNGIKWRSLPCDFRLADGLRVLPIVGQIGIWEQINHALVQDVRLSEGRDADPSLAIIASLAIIDSQSIKLGQKGGTNRGAMGINK